MWRTVTLLALLLGRLRAGTRYSACSSRSSKGRWAAMILRRASSSESHSMRSISGKSCLRPDRGGHSISKVLELSRAGSQSPVKAQAKMRFPLFWTISPSGRKGGVTAKPVSSVNSRWAAARASSGGRYSPFGMVQAPSSLPRQNGPPGWASSTCMLPSPLRRYMSNPALFFGIGKTQSSGRRHEQATGALDLDADFLGQPRLEIGKHGLGLDRVVARVVDGHRQVALDVPR